VHSLKVCNNKIFRRLDEDCVRDKINKGELEREECDDKEVYNFLLLLKKKQDEQNTEFTQIIKEEWEFIARKAKKRSTSSIFSNQICAVCKYALGSKRMSYNFLRYYNTLINRNYYPKR